MMDKLDFSLSNMDVALRGKRALFGNVWAACPLFCSPLLVPPINRQVADTIDLYVLLSSLNSVSDCKGENQEIPRRVERSACLFPLGI